MGASGRQREQLKLVDTIDTNGMTVVQMLELNDQYLLVIGHMSMMQIFRRLEPEERSDGGSKEAASNDENEDTFDLSVNFNGLLSKLTRTTKPY